MSLIKDYSNLLTLPATNIVPENWWLEDDPFLFGARTIFSGNISLWAYHSSIGAQLLVQNKPLHVWWPVLFKLAKELVEWLEFPWNITYWRFECSMYFDLLKYMARRNVHHQKCMAFKVGFTITGQFCWVAGGFKDFGSWSLPPIQMQKKLENQKGPNGSPNLLTC